jgi:PKD repeat protein
MASYGARKRLRSIAIMLLVLIFLSACTLGRSTNAPNEEEITSVPSLEVEQTPQETAQLLLTNTPRPFQTVLPATSIFPTASVSFPTQIGSVATAVPPQQVSIFILSPVPGNIVSGSTQIIGSATHSNFLQYQLEYGPDPNPSNLWYSVSGAVQSPVVNGLLGIWNTSVLNDGAYQLRLRVFLRDGTDGGTVTVNNIMVRNQAPTPVPSATPVIERPIAAFTQSATVGTAPLNVQFTNLSTGSITALQWNFGDGSTSTEINPTHRFNNPGAYSVTLTASGPGGTSNVTRQILVQSPNPPVAAFTPDKTEGLAPLTVTFTDISSGGQITERLWNFGNGQTTTRNNADPVTHTFQSVGTYNVILQVSGPGGLSTATRQIRVGNPIEADIRVTPDTSNPLRFVLEAVVSGGSGSYTNYNWNFGNGQSQTGAQTTATYAASGTYTIQLQVRDSQGNEALVNRIVEVRLPTATPTQTQTPVPPSATATHTLTATTEPSVEPSQTEVAVVNSPVPPVDDLLASFTVHQTSSTDLTVGFDGYAEGGTGTYSYAWEFGDGAFGDGQSASHAYPSAGTYTVRLTVNDGQTSQQAENVVVIEDVPLPALVASFTVNQTSPTDLTVGFDGYAEGGTGTYSYAWEFGDGAFGDGQSASHTYPSAGTYTVRLTVNDGQTSQQAENVVVIEDVPLPALVASFTVNQTSSTDLTVGFDGYAEGGTGTYSYAWEFGDGAFGDGQSASHTYPNAGTYTVRLTVNDGQTSQQAENVVIIEDVPLPALVASFTVNQTSSTDLTVGFDAYAEGGTGTYSYAWEFGDGTFGDGQSASHAYPSAGTYTVRLTVNDGQTSQQAENVVVIDDVPLPALVASFTVNQTSSTDLTVGFDGYAEGGTGTYSYAWEFGDGAFGDGQSASHTYPNAGTYTVRLTVNDGQTSQQAENVVVIEDVPVLPELVITSFNSSANPSDPYHFNFSVSVTGGTETYSYRWEFGDGAVEMSPEPSFGHRYATQGQYMVTVFVNDGNSEQSANTTVSITTQSITPVQPDVNPYIPEMTNIYNNATAPEQENPRNPSVIAVIGDQTVNNTNFLSPILQQENYQLDDSTQHISGTIDRFASGLSQQDAPTLDSLLAPSTCDPNISQVVCYINQTQTTVIVIGVGLQEANNPNAQEYQNKLTEVVNQAKNANAIPILVTLYPTNDPAIQDGINIINEAIIQVATNTSVPVINVWRGLNELPEQGLSGNTPSIDPMSGASYLSANSTGGANMMNYYTLETLTQILNAISP